MLLGFDAKGAQGFPRCLGKGVHEKNHRIKTMQYTQKVYRTFYVENVI